MTIEKCQVVRTPRQSFRWMADLLWMLSVHRINVRYKETFLGFGWIFLQPVALTIIFNYIQKVARISSGGIPYPLFAGTGLVAWTLTSLVIGQSAVSIGGHASLLKRIAFPKILLPLSVIVASAADLVVMGILFSILFLFYPYSFSAAWGWVLFLCGIHLILLIGAGCILALVNVYLRDVGHALPSLLQILFFASPVFYPSSMVPAEFRTAARWNPMTGIIEGYRSAFLLGQAPAWDTLLPAAISSVVILILGLLCFWKLEVYITDIL